MLNNEYILIRPCDIKDIQVCAEAIFESEFGKLYYPSLSFLKIILRDAVEKDYVLVAENKNYILGFIWFSKKTMFAKYPYLNLIFVFENFRNIGVGYKLLQYFEKQCMKNTKNPKVKLFLVVKDTNNNAKRFYEKNGYYSIGKIEGLYRSFISEEIMMKDLEYIF